MQTITFNPQTNSLTVCEDGKPRAGFINCDGSEQIYRRVIRRNIKKLEENIEAIDAWCIDKRNLKHYDKQVELRQKRAEIQIKILQLKQELKPAKFSGIREISI